VTAKRFTSLASRRKADIPIVAEVRALIVSARHTMATAVNASLTALYWQIGVRIRRDVLREKRAGYGEEIVAALGRQLETEFGRGFEEKNLRRMVQFAYAFPDEQIVAALLRQLGWTHFKLIVPIHDPLKRAFYAEMCRVERWSTRTLRRQIDGMLYERTALSKKPAKLIEKELSALRTDGTLTPDLVFKDPYVLDFLGLRDTYSEKDLEAAILRDIERFLLELGAGFAFVERQKRIVIDGEDFHLDLLLFHRRLRRLVLIELKLRAFREADFGQTTLYLRWPIATSGSRARSRRSVSSCAPARRTSASSCSSSNRAAFAWRSTSPSYHPRRSWSGASTKRSSPREPDWRRAPRRPDARRRAIARMCRFVGPFWARWATAVREEPNGICPGRGALT
jgi:predicted nuclease of restriction endonuclease-like (RecB) superfamily